MPEDPNLVTETEPVEPEPETEPAEPSPATPPAVDYEKKFKESAKENQLLREAEAARKKAEQESTKEPTDSELRTAFPEWESLSDFEKGIARRTLNAERIAAGSAKTAGELASERSWNTGIELAVQSDDRLQGKETAFKQFANRPQYRGVSMELLVSAFLGEQPPAQPSTPTPRRPGLETGSGGPKRPEQPKLLNGEQLKLLRQSDERGYKAYIETHDIKPEDM